MKRRGFTIPGFKYREWEQAGKAYTYATKGVALTNIENPKDYEFANESSDQEPAIYGWTSNQGLCVLRRFDIQNAIRHEFGHMVGLGFHHQDCAMDWNCSVHKFCANCVKDINEIWELDDNSACGAGGSIKPGA